MNTLEYVPVPAFTDNYIWLVSNGRDAVVVDPGEAAPVRAFLAQRRLRLSAILLTHHHADHVGGVADLCGHSSIPVYGPAAEAIAEVTHPLSGGDRVRLESPAMDLAVLDVPGHTRGHIAYFQDGRAGAAPHVPPAPCVLRRYALRLRLRAALRRHAGANACLARRARVIAR
jgi:hydroxyacylglutathione hydrolase